MLFANHPSFHVDFCSPIGVPWDLFKVQLFFRPFLPSNSTSMPQKTKQCVYRDLERLLPSVLARHLHFEGVERGTKKKLFSLPPFHCPHPLPLFLYCDPPRINYRTPFRPDSPCLSRPPSNAEQFSFFHVFLFSIFEDPDRCHFRAISLFKPPFSSILSLLGFLPPNQYGLDSCLDQCRVLKWKSRPWTFARWQALPQSRF